MIIPRFALPTDTQTTDAAFTPAGWDSMRLINSLLSAEKTPWGPDALFQDVVAVPPNAGRGHGGADDAVAGADLNAKPKEPEEAVESEEMWLSRLDKQVQPLGHRLPWYLKTFFFAVPHEGPLFLLHASQTLETGVASLVLKYTDAFFLTFLLSSNGAMINSCSWVAFGCGRDGEFR